MSHIEAIVPEHAGQEWADLDLDEIKEKFKEHGALLFRGFAGDVDKLAFMTDQFCDSYMCNPNADRNPVAPDKQIETVPRGTSAFELHSERHQTPPTPHICFFYCNVAPRKHGETTFCDGELLVSVLRDELREVLSKRNLGYFNIALRGDLASILGLEDPAELQQALVENNLENVYQIIDEDSVRKTFITPFFHISRFHGKPAFANFLLYSRYMFKQKEYPTFGNGRPVPDEICDEIRNAAVQITVAHKWQDGDLLMLDNTRFMHGRNQVEPDCKRDIWTRFGYANFK